MVNIKVCLYTLYITKIISTKMSKCRFLQCTKDTVKVHGSRITIADNTNCGFNNNVKKIISFLIAIQNTKPWQVM